MMSSLNLVFAYFSPETFLPMTSILASAVGFLLLFGRNVLQLVRRILRFATARGRRPESIPKPHFRFNEERVEETQPVPSESADHAHGWES
jgi:hypothetical protein